MSGFEEGWNGSLSGGRMKEILRNDIGLIEKRYVDFSL